MTESLLALAAATAILVAIPGPNVALIVANSLRYGFGAGASTVIGTTLGVALQLVVVVAGTVALIEFAAAALAWIRWLGVAYLVWLGIRIWRQPPADLDPLVAERVVFWRGCVLAAVNPKTLLFGAAFLPQFVPSEAAALQAVAVACVYLTVLLLGDLLWATFASAAKGLLGRVAGLHRQLSGAFLVAAGFALALARRDLS